MKKLLLYIMMCATLTAQATRPVRTLRTRLADGSLAPLSYSPLRADDKHEGCPSHMGQQALNTRALHARNTDGLGTFGESGMGVLNSIGSPKIPVIMVEFSDVAFQASTTPALVDSIFNRKGYKQNKLSRGSVRDYFVAQSYGMFQPSFDIVGKVKTAQPRAYYGKNEGSSKNVNIVQLYREAIEKAAAQGTDFSQYASQGSVPLVVLYHAGPGEHDAFETGREDYVWAHFSDTYLRNKGVDFKGYFVGCELMQTYRSKIEIVDGKEVKKPVLDSHGNPIVQDAQLEGIGVLCHELCHALGLPDFYSTEEAQETPDYHDLMDYGQYGNDGYRPVGLSAYERNCLGWLKLEELGETPQRGRIAALGESDTKGRAQGYLVRNKNNPKEYFVLENRQPNDWFFTSLGRGMLVHHIDYNQSAWFSNRVNTNAQRLRYTVVAADGKWQGNKTATAADYAGDFFPGTQHVVNFTPDGTPAMRWYNPADERPIYQIAQEADGTVSFSYLDKTLHLTLPVHKFSSQKLTTLDGRHIAPEQAAPGIYLQSGRKVVFR